MLVNYIGYSNIDNPKWYKRMCRNMFKIRKYTWEINNTWVGWFVKREKLKRVVEKLKSDNRKILKREFTSYGIHSYDDLFFTFDMWVNHRSQSLPVLEVWLK